jgi:hypothetical protein
MSKDFNGVAPPEKSDDPPTESTWSADELDDIPERSAARDIDRTAGMTEQQARSAALICCVIIACFAGSGLFLRQLYPASQKPEFSDCARVAASSERLACYDKVANTNAADPFKGAWPFSAASRFEN